MASCNNTSLPTGNTSSHDCNDGISGPGRGFPVPGIPSYLKDITRTVYICTLLLGVIGNVLVSFIIVRKPKPRKGIHIFTLNLSISDLVVLIVYLPLQMNLFENDMLWSLGEVFCKISYLIIPLSIYASVGTLIAITWDRYMAIVHPLTNIQEGRPKRAILIIWLIAFVMTMPLLLVSGVDYGFCVEANWPNESLERAYWILMFLIQCVFPILFFAVAYGVIIINLKQRSFPLEQTEYAKARLLARKRQHQSVIKLAVALILVYIICVLPQHVVFFWVFYGNLLKKDYSLYVFLMANLMSIVNSAINPVIYGTLNKEIKKGLALLLRCHCLPKDTERYMSSRKSPMQTKQSLYEKSGSLLNNRLLFFSSKEASKQHNLSRKVSCKKDSNFNIDKRIYQNETEEKKQSTRKERYSMIQAEKINQSDEEITDLGEPNQSNENLNSETKRQEAEVSLLNEKTFITENHIVTKITKRHGKLFPKCGFRFKKNNERRKRVTFSSKEDHVTFIPL